MGSASGIDASYAASRADARPSAVTPASAWTSTALAALLACVVLLVPLGHKPLVAWDEGIYAEVSREMLSHSWLTPHWNGQPWFEKPPLMLWITAALFKLFGVGEFTARAASALSGVATVGLLHGWLARRNDRLAAWLSTFMLLSTFGFLHICSLGEMDVLLSLACLVAVLGLVKVQQLDAAGWYLFWVGFAVALMTKGAASVVLLLMLIAFVALHRPWRIRRNAKPFLLGLLLFLLLTLPWHLFMLHRFGQAFLHEYLGYHVLSRATAQIEDHHTHAWYYLGVLLAQAAPWVLLYPFAIAATFRLEPARGKLRTLRLLSTFALIVLVFFTVVQTRLPHYIAPMYPALTLVAAVYAAEKLRAWRVAACSPAVRGGWVLAAVAVWGLCAFATDVPRKRLHSAKLTRGAVSPDSRETAQLLKALRQQPSLPSGPLLLWSQADSTPIAPAVFYAQRQVQQVQLQVPDPAMPTDKYLHAPTQLACALAAGPRVLMMDRDLLPSLPAEYVFTPMQTGKTLAAGVLSRKPHLQ